MSRKITISKYEENTQYSVHVEDSYGTEHHLGYYSILTPQNDYEIMSKAEEIWANEVEPKEDLMANAIKEMIEIGPRFTDSRGNHRDGLD